VRHGELVSIDHVVKVATSLFLDTEAVNLLDGIASESL
jgi:hypothetical protein